MSVADPMTRVLTTAMSADDRLTPDWAGRRMTADEFDATEVDDTWRDFRYELLREVVIVMPPPKPAHRAIDDALGYVLRDYRSRHPQGAALTDTLPEHYLRIGADRRIADRVIWAGLGRRPNPISDVPSIVVEIVSAGRRNAVRDYQEKRAEYLSIGVREYWIVDRFARTLTVVSGSAASPAERVIAAGQSYATPLLPGFELSPGRLFAQADDWDRPTQELAPPTGEAQP